MENSEMTNRSLLILPRQFHCLDGSSLIPFFDNWSRVAGT
jgi:hypothetical protein